MVFVRIVYALWLVLVGYLTISAFGARKDAKPDLVQSYGLLFAIVAAFVLPRLRPFKFVNFAPGNRVVSIFGVVACTAGMAFQIWARQTLGKNWSQTVSAKVGHELVTSGPYRFVRHPMYTGGFLACFASAIVAGGPFVFAALTVGPIMLWRVGAEDELMTRQFPNEYPAYMERTKALIPFIW
ncbi:MAG: methyltransferase family protein [Chloroflexota bacterium]